MSSAQSDMTTKYKLVDVDKLEKILSEVKIDSFAGEPYIANLYAPIRAMLEASPAQESEPVAKQAWPNHNWCVGCDPDNCSGCGTEPLERRTQPPADVEPVAWICLVDDEEIFYTDKAQAYGNGKNAEVTPLYLHPPADKDAERIAEINQAITDEENQPSQFGTVPLAWYENLESKLERVGKVIDSLEGSYEKHAIRKALQEAIE